MTGTTCDDQHERMSGRWLVAIIVLGPVLLVLLGTLFELLR